MMTERKDHLNLTFSIRDIDIIQMMVRRRFAAATIARDFKVPRAEIIALCERCGFAIPVQEVRLTDHQRGLLRYMDKTGLPIHPEGGSICLGIHRVSMDDLNALIAAQALDLGDDPARPFRFHINTHGRELASQKAVR